MTSQGNRTTTQNPMEAAQRRDDGIKKGLLFCARMALAPTSLKAGCRVSRAAPDGPEIACRPAFCLRILVGWPEGAPSRSIMAVLRILILLLSMLRCVGHYSYCFQRLGSPVLLIVLHSDRGSSVTVFPRLAAVPESLAVYTTPYIKQ